MALPRLQKLAAHLLPSTNNSNEVPYLHNFNHHSLSPTAFLPRAAAIEPDALAVYHQCSTGEIVERSYKELSERAAALAWWLRKGGFKRVGILCPNTPAFLEAVYAVAGAGAVQIGVNYRLKEDDVAYIFEHAQADIILVDKEYVSLLNAFKAAHPDVPFLVDEDTPPNQTNPYEKALLSIIPEAERTWIGLEHHAKHEEDVIALAYTSGTTARPKGVEYTHRGCYLAAMGNVIESGLNIEASATAPPELESQKLDRCGYLWTLPIFHATGWTFPWAVTAIRGTHFLLRKIDYPHIWKLLSSQPITHFNAAPTVNTLLCADENAVKLPRPVRVTVAASPPTAHLFQTMTELNLHPVHVYGLTETYGPITKGYHMPAWSSMAEKDKYAQMARQGHGFVTSQAVRVIKTGDDVPLDQVEDVERNGKEIGEIVFTGNICAKGYFRDAEATRKLFAGGVLHSGDLAVWHEDGAIKILDRAKDIIISGGENISSVALESMLVTNPSILEAGVVAVQDPKWGECPKAYITVKQGKEITGEEVIAWAKQARGISRFMVPREVEVVKELPKTSTGKIRKNELREWAREGRKDA
ncbi:putative AMP-binding domain protein [Aulographum hederae CBS 113979]|uniref:Putative AMP-binding domain protein n=1 Tax=Aulographum hederae CBS 113979 TaxID=1176131 RepID=A0A6G1GWC7_9PEZI|nr:putative AMP-binding domain protein [Aulographum hederae CBS 113979]